MNFKYHAYEVLLGTLLCNSIKYLGVITQGWVITPKANATCSYEGVKKIVTPCSERKNFESLESQTTTKINLLHL